MTKKSKKDTQKNLIPFNKLTEEEQRKLAIKGGKASVKARREKKKTQEIAKALVEQFIKNKNGEEKSIKEVMFIKQMEKALRGDRIAYELVLALIGEDPVHKQEIISANVQYQKVFVSKQDENIIEQHIENFINE